MKKGRFLWSAHRITERQKAGKARSIKGKQLKNSRNTASRLLVARPSSASAEFPSVSSIFDPWLRLQSWVIFLCSRFCAKNSAVVKSRKGLQIQHFPNFLGVKIVQNHAAVILHDDAFLCSHVLAKSPPLVRLTFSTLPTSLWT